MQFVLNLIETFYLSRSFLINIKGAELKKLTPCRYEIIKTVYLFIAAIPGNSFPSKNSSMAPPPVEI